MGDRLSDVEVRGLAVMCKRLEAERDAAVKRAEAAVGLLRRLEWSGWSAGGCPVCPDCGGSEAAKFHSSDCHLALFLKDVTVAGYGGSHD